jgi:hypothetical protein
MAFSVPSWRTLTRKYRGRTCKRRVNGVVRRLPTQWAIKLLKPASGGREGPGRAEESWRALRLCELAHITRTPAAATLVMEAGKPGAQCQGPGTRRRQAHRSSNS